MAILSAGDAIFAQVYRGEFDSPFPSSDALVDSKFTALMAAVDPTTGKSLASEVFSRAQAVAWQHALSMSNMTKATLVGDFPTAWIPKLAFYTKEKGALGGMVNSLQGLWTAVVFPDTADPARLGLAVANAGLDVALDFCGAVPIVGGLMKFIVNLGDMLAGLFGGDAPVSVRKRYLPWGKYSDATDTAIVRLIINQYYGKVDWTNLFLPPYETDVPWTTSIGLDDNKDEMGVMWAPSKGGQLAAVGGFGCMPGTFRMAGFIQSPNVPQEPNAHLHRYFSDGTFMRWGRVLTDQGEFFPATAQTGVLAWQQAQKAGSPDMYKLDCDAIEAAWIAYFDQFFDSVWREYYDNDEWAGEWASPYIAVKTKEWRLGWRDRSSLANQALTEIHRPHPAALITPDIFTTGPATPATRNLCLFVESEKGPDQGDTGIMAAVYEREYPSGRFIKSGGPAWPPNSKLPKGGRCVPWPSAQELLAKYGRPDDVFIVPAVQRLRELQLRSLESTLVSAYCRPVDVKGLPAYAAFRKNTVLRDRCLEVRKMLLNHEARFQVNLRDVHDIDPDFELQLRAAGVDNSPAQMAAKFKLAAGPLGGKKSEPLPEPLPPAGGTVPFDRGGSLVAGPGGGRPSSGSTAGRVAGGALLLGAALLGLRRR